MPNFESVVRSVDAFFERVRKGCVSFMGFDPTPNIDTFSFLPYIQWVVWSITVLGVYTVLWLGIGIPISFLEKYVFGSSRLFEYVAFTVLFIVSITAATRCGRWVILTFLPPEKKPES